MGVEYKLPNVPYDHSNTPVLPASAYTLRSAQAAYTFPVVELTAGAAYIAPNAVNVHSRVPLAALNAKTWLCRSPMYSAVSVGLKPGEDQNICVAVPYCHITVPVVEFNAKRNPSAEARNAVPAMEIVTEQDQLEDREYVQIGTPLDPLSATRLPLSEPTITASLEAIAAEATTAPNVDGLDPSTGVGYRQRTLFVCGPQYGDVFCLVL